MTTSTMGPVFIVGSMRSGSTMLRLILDSHPSIAIPGETGFMGGAQAAKRIPNWNFGEGWYERLGWSEAEFDARLGEFYRGLFDRYAAAQGKPRWGEKTPFHVSHVPLMARLFPDAVFVAIVRHPGAVASSLTQRFHYTFRDALSYWVATSLDLVRAGRELDDRFALVRYEDVVEEGEPVLRDLVAHLGEVWTPDLLQHHRVQQDKGAPRAVEGSTVSSKPIDARRVGAWAGSVEAADMDELRSVDALASFFGYAATDPVERLPWEESAGHLLRGSGLRSRVESWESRIDFEHRRLVPSVDAPPEELAARLLQTEQALARMRSRRAVRAVDALRRFQHGRSRQDLVAAWRALQRT